MIIYVDKEKAFDSISKKFKHLKGYNSLFLDDIFTNDHVYLLLFENMFKNIKLEYPSTCNNEKNINRLRSLMIFYRYWPLK